MNKLGFMIATRYNHCSIVPTSKHEKEYFNELEQVLNNCLNVVLESTDFSSNAIYVDDIVDSFKFLFNDYISKFNYSNKSFYVWLEDIFYVTSEEILNEEYDIPEEYQDICDKLMKNYNFGDGLIVFLIITSDIFIKGVPITITEYNS